MENKSAYSHLAKWFEYLNDDCGYEQWSQYLIMQLKQYSLYTGLDIGCGGGWFTRAFQKAGYQMTGLDIAPQMLDYAQEQALKTGVRSTYILGDITKTKFPRRFDFATAVNDCVNYIPKTRLLTAFKNVAASLKKDGVFLFDISSKRKFEEKIANTVSVDDRENVTYLAFNKMENDRVTMDVTLFVQESNGAYRRFDETHTQYVYSENEITQCLQQAGFVVKNVEGHMNENKNNSDRICFLAQKE